MTDQSSVGQTTVIGADPAVVTEALKILMTDGATALEAYILTLNPELAAALSEPIVKQVFDMVVSGAVNFIVKEGDRAAFAIYVAFSLGTQVSKYQDAQISGDQSAIDQAGDNLGKLTNE